MSKKLILPALIAVLGATPAAAEVWTVMEGTAKASRGTWQVNAIGSELTGTGEMTDDKGQRVTFKLAGTTRNGEYTMQRVGPSNGMNCVYRGDMKQPGKINGSAMCGSSPAAWFVTRQ